MSHSKGVIKSTKSHRWNVYLVIVQGSTLRRVFQALERCWLLSSCWPCYRRRFSSLIPWVCWFLCSKYEVQNIQNQIKFSSCPYAFYTCYSDCAFYFPVLSSRKHKKYLILCYKSFLFHKYFFSLADLGLDQFIVKRYDGKVSTLY